MNKPLAEQMLDLLSPGTRARVEAEVAKVKTFNELAYEYRPYHAMPAFAKGAEDYMDRNYACPYSGPHQGLDAQAWDRGAECAMRFTRQYA